MRLNLSISCFIMVCLPGKVIIITASQMLLVAVGLKKGARKGPKKVQNMVQNMVQKWSKNGPKMVQKIFQK